MYIEKQITLKVALSNCYLSLNLVDKIEYMEKFNFLILFNVFIKRLKPRPTDSGLQQRSKLCMLFHTSRACFKY